MLPLRAAARSPAPRRAVASAASVPSARRAAIAYSPMSSFSTAAAGPSRCAGAYVVQHARPSLSRQLHATARTLKDKRWVNSALKNEDGGEGEGEPEGKRDVEPNKPEDNDGKAPSDANKREPVTPEAESSKAAEKRAAENNKAGGSSSASGAGANAPPAPPPLGGGSAGLGGGGAGGKAGSKEIAKPSIPEVYPQVLALPITRRPLFPGFYKAVTITSPAVIKAIRDLIAHGQPYIGAFLLKDSESDSDVITSLDQVHPVGVFAQITSVFSSADASRQPDTEDNGEPRPETLTAVLYPHRRIRIDDLVAPSPPQAPDAATDAASTATEAETADKPPKAEAEVASFETEVPTVEETKEALKDTLEDASETTADTTSTTPKPQIGFLHPLLPEISLTNVSNLALEPHKKDSQVVRAIMGEILAVFKEIAQLQPIFREQSEYDV